MAFYAIPPRDSPLAPKFWRYETSGQLALAVRSYLYNPDAMTPRYIVYMRAYLVQWIDSPAWDANPAHTIRSRAALEALRVKVVRIRNGRDISAWLQDALREGVDPL